MPCTHNNNASHNVHFDFFNVSKMYVPMYIKCSSQIDLRYINSDVHEMYMRLLADTGMNNTPSSHCTPLLPSDHPRSRLSTKHSLTDGSPTTHLSPQRCSAATSRTAPLPHSGTSPLLVPAFDPPNPNPRHPVNESVSLLPAHQPPQLTLTELWLLLAPKHDAHQRLC